MKKVEVNLFLIIIILSSLMISTSVAALSASDQLCLAAGKEIGCVNSASTSGNGVGLKDAVKSTDGQEDKCAQQSDNLIDFISKHPEIYYSGSPYWKALSKLSSQEREQFIVESEQLNALKPSKEGPCKLGGVAFPSGDRCTCPYSKNLCDKCSSADYLVKRGDSQECVLGKWYEVKPIVTSTEKVLESRRTFLDKLFGWNTEEDKTANYIATEFKELSGRTFPCTVSFSGGKPICDKQLEQREDGSFRFK